jgi:hypothetical protein
MKILLICFGLGALFGFVLVMAAFVVTLAMDVYITRKWKRHGITPYLPPKP